MKMNQDSQRLLLIIMKVTLIQFCMVVLFTSLVMGRDAHAQEVLNQQITLKAENSDIKSILSLVERQVDVKFMYSAEVIQSKRKVSISAKNERLSELLMKLLTPLKISFEVNKKRILLTSSEIPSVEALESRSLAETESALITVSGTVINIKGEGIPGVTIREKDTNTGAVTDVNGKFTISVRNEQSVLIFTSIGYKPSEIQVSKQKIINLTLSDDNTQLNEIVVIGYGTQKKSELTSAVATVKSENFIKGAVTDAGQLLQGKVAGLTIGSPSGDPTSTSQIVLRGISSINSSTDPLVLIDGIPGGLNTVAPEDIESIDVLKDGSAAAIYGTRGTNGVILITTRRANGNIEPSIEYNGYVSTQTIARKPEMFSASDYRNLIKQGVPFEDLGSDTDWLKATTRTPLIHVHNLTLRGGNSRTNYLANVNYRSFEGIFQKSDNRTLTGRLDVNHNMFDGKLKLNINFINTNNAYTTTGDGVSFNGGAYRQALIRNPTSPIKNPDGSWFEQPGIYVYENPLARLYESDGENTSQNTRLAGSLSFLPVNGLEMKALFSQNRFNQIRGYSETKNHISTIRDTKNGYASRGTTQNTDGLIELTAEYRKTMDDHKFSALAGYSYQDFLSEDYWMQNWDFPTDKFTYNNIGTGNALKKGLAPIYSNKLASNLIGFFGRVTYSYADKYILLASLRHEASSKLLGAIEPWGNFPAVSVGWKINKESFLSNAKGIDELKLRAGYGVTGTVPGASFLGVSRLGYSGNFLVNGQWVQNLAPINNPNPYLRWEEKHETNVGIDFSFLKSRVSGSLDFYNRRTNGLIYDYPVPTPPNLYPFTTANVGVMENKGIEVMVNVAVVRSKDFDWNASFNYSTNANKLVSLSNDQYKTTNDFFTTGYTGEPIQTYTHRVQVGEKIGNFYGYKVVDVTDDGKWIYETKTGERSTDKGGEENKKILGNGLPAFYAGWNNNFRYKNFDLSITMRGAFDYQILNFQRMYYENPGITQYNQLKTAQDKVFGKAVLNKNTPLEYNSYYIENGDFWKIDNITLGYNFTHPIFKVIKRARLYVAVLNSLTITGYKGIDPEVNRGGLSPGNDDRDKYPTVRTFTFGMNLNF